MKKINVITLGCSKNTVDSEHLMAQLAAAGYTVTHDSDRTDAKVVVINTCGFIGDAKQESIDMILRAAAAKQTGKIERLFVVGCLSERYAEELRAELPEVDEFFGVKDWDDIVRALEATPRPALATERRLTTPKHYAYLKISEGCNWKCGYCAIPLIRGPHASVPMETLLEEARKLAAGGVRELIVIAQDTTYYGLDLYGKRRLAELLEALCRIDGIRWIRLHYAYPTAFPDARPCWSDIRAKPKPTSKSFWNSCARYGSNDWAYSPIPKRREPIRPGICRTMFRKRSNKVV